MSRAILKTHDTGKGGLLLELSGDWVLGGVVPSVQELTVALQAHAHIQKAGFEASGLGKWDSALLTFLVGLNGLLAERKIAVDPSGLPAGARRLLTLATAIPEKQGARRQARREGLLTRFGNFWLAWLAAQHELLTFVGEVCIAFGKWARGRAQYRRADLWDTIEECGVRSLPIVTLISVLIGLILAFVGAMQLAMFGAQIYVADLVGVGTVREMAPLMTGIIMAGRVGSAFAARLGTMQVNEEIDAFKTLGLSPTEFLVLPRVLALTAMMPLLCLYADFLGIAGGALVSIGMFGISPLEYWAQSRSAIGLDGIAIGVFKSGLFGALIAIAGCLSGIACGRSALAVGTATTQAVVKSIVWIIVADSIFAIISSLTGL